MKDLLKYGLIASAGQPRNLTGEGVVALGALFTQMDFGLGSEEEPINNERSLTERLQLEKDLQDKNGNKLEDLNKADLFSQYIFAHKGSENLGKGIELPARKIAPPPSDGVGGKEGVGDERFGSIEHVLYGPGEQFRDFGLTGIPSYTPLPGSDAEEKPMFDLQNSPAMQGLRGMGASVQNFFTGGKYDTGGFPRLKPEILENLEKLRYKNKGKDDTPLFRAAHVAKSAFVRTDNIDYRQMKQATAPGYTGEIGKAAAEGYNLVIDKYNYDQAVKTDYEEELDDQMGSLNVPADFISDEARENYLALASGKKKQLGEAFNDWSNGKMSKLDYENTKASLTSEIKMAAAARTNVTNSIKDFMENKGLYDIDASDSEMVDFFMTGEKSPEKISIKNVDGVDYITGTTRGGKEFKVPTSKIANGTAGFRLVKKANLAPVISGALKNISAYTTSTKTDLGFGTSTPNIEKAKEIGIASIKSSLGANEGDLRSIMAQVYGVDHTAYQNFLGGDANANKNEMLSDAAEYLYDTQVADKYFPQTKTTKFTTQQRGVSLTAGEREIAQIKSKLDNMPIPTTANIDNYMTLLKLNKGEAYQVKDNKLIIGDVKAGTAIRTIDLSNPTLAKSQIANLAGVKGYSGPAYDAKSLIQKYK
mgnify:CR=1 FL=1|tara:strand:- start:9895 stop:11838 length:1944 start_codon:yes stop_codon:yes gene_type:complete